MRNRDLLPWIPLLLALTWTPSALADGYLQVTAEGDVQVLVDGQGVGNLDVLGTATLTVESGIRHELIVQNSGGTQLARRTVEVGDGNTVAVHWDGQQLSTQSASPGFQGLSSSAYTSSATRSSSGEQERASAMRTAQAGAAIAGIVAPTSPGVALVQTGLTAVSAGTTVARTAQSVSSSARHHQTAGPSATTAREDHGTEALQQSGFDPYEATGGRPTIDATLASVTFVVSAGTEAMITVDGQPVATIADGTTEATVAVIPGLRKVMIFDPSGVNLIHQGYLTATAGYVFELHFSATEPPVSTLPDTWR